MNDVNLIIDRRDRVKHEKTVEKIQALAFFFLFLTVASGVGIFVLTLNSPLEKLRT